MQNLEIAKILYNISVYLEILDVKWKPRAYAQAARSIERMQDDIELVAKQHRLESIPGVGKAISQKIVEYLKTGKIKEYELLQRKVPLDINALMSVEGLGPKKIKILYHKLGVKDLKSLELCARKHKIQVLQGFGEKTERNILKGIEFVKHNAGRILLGKALPIANSIKNHISKLECVRKISLAGSIRRMSETIGDIDILVSSRNASAVMKRFIKMPGVEKVWASGKTKSSVHLRAGFDVDLRVIKSNSWGSALQYFTGSKEHNIALRRIALKKGLKLNEYGVFRNKAKIAGKTEEGVYKALGMQYIPPEIRQNGVELDLAIKHKIPKLIDYNDIKGDLHLHTDWSDGINSLEQIIQACENIGYNYIAITDHAGYMSKLQNGLDANRLSKQCQEIDALNKKYKIHILKGAELNITKTGNLDLRQDILSKLDFVVAGVHSNFQMNKKDMTSRIIYAMQNYNINMIAHPTGRIIKKRVGYKLDWDKIFLVAKQTNTALELNASMDRLDIDYNICSQAVKSGVKVIISTDSHSVYGLWQMQLGVAQARKAMCVKQDIVNTRVSYTNE